MPSADEDDESDMKMSALPGQEEDSDDHTTSIKNTTAAASNNNNNIHPPAAPAASIPAQPQHQLPINLDLNSLKEVDMTDPQKQNLIYTVRNMLLQQADLCHRQADTLEQYSQNISQNREYQYENNNRDNTISHKHLEEQITRKLEREAVLKLAKKSYEGMKELQKTMKVFIDYQQRQSRKVADSSHDSGRIQQDSDSDSDDSQEDTGTNYIFGQEEENELILATRNQKTRTKSVDEFNTNGEEGTNYLQEFANSQLSQQSSTRVTTPMKRERDEESSSSEEEENDTSNQNEKEQSLTFEDSDDDDDDGPGYLDQFAQNINKPPIHRERDDDSSSDDDSSARKRIKME